MYSHYDFVFLELDLHTVINWGPGFWKFNNTLLQDEDFCALISDLIDSFLFSRTSFQSDMVMWHCLKDEIKRFSISFSREKRRLFSWEKVSLINRLSLLKRRLATGDSLVKLAISELELALKHLFERQLESSKIRSRTKLL